MTRRSTAPPLHCTQLDPRDADDALVRPIVSAVNIPLSEMAGRTHELPPRDEMIDVVGPADLAAQAVAWLSDNGRRGRAVERFDYADPYAEAVTGRLWRPNPWLEQILPEFEPGRALDLACGMGREAVHMASLGWRVTAIDRLPDALERARALEARYGEERSAIDWIKGDLESGDPPIRGTFDLIVGFRFLHRPLFSRLSKWLRAGGHFVYETFTTLHRERNTRPSREAFLLEPGELPTLVGGLIIRRHEESWTANAHTARIWATAPP